MANSNTTSKFSVLMMAAGIIALFVGGYVAERHVDLYKQMSVLSEHRIASLESENVDLKSALASRNEELSQVKAALEEEKSRADQLSTFGGFLKEKFGISKKEGPVESPDATTASNH